jgi:hypothetical protein
MSSKRYTKARIDTSQGCDGFLNPPGHPEHTVSVETDTDRPRDYRGFTSLSAAASDDAMDPAVRAEAKRLLDAWAANAPPLESAEVQAWVLQVLGYFRGCYRNPDKSGTEQWHASHLVIRDDRYYSPVEHAGDHAGVRFIREYYPGFAPTAEHFVNARWGSPKGTE